MAATVGPRTCAAGCSQAPPGAHAPGVLPANDRSVYIEEQGRAAGRLDERARRTVTALLLAPSSDTLCSFDATPVLPCDTFAGRSLDQPDAARPFRSCTGARRPPGHSFVGTHRRAPPVLPGFSDRRTHLARAGRATVHACVGKRMPFPRRRGGRRPFINSRWQLRRLECLCLFLSPTVRATLTAWMKIYGEPNDV